MIQKFVDSFLHIQRKFALPITVLAIFCGFLTFRPAIGLLKSVATDLIHLLPDNYAAVKYTDEIRQKFNRRSSLYVIISSEDVETNKQVMLDMAEHIKKLDGVGEVSVTKKGYDFFEDFKLLLIDLSELYKIHDRLKEKIQRKKLSGLYIDLEEGEEKKKEITFDDIIDQYKAKFTEGVRSEYRQNEEGTVFVVNIYPESSNSGLSFFKSFGKRIREHVKKFDFSKYKTKVDYGYAGAIWSRVEQYDALIYGLKKAGIFSGATIFILLYIYFGFFIHSHKKGLWAHLTTYLFRLTPVILIFIPMIISTLLAFAFNSLFFENLNVVTSFLFAIIFGLGVDIGIHLISRYIQDRSRGISIEEAHHNIFVKTGKSATIGILTTVATFYIITFTDFKGFSEFGWIAGHGLVIALFTYLLLFPCLLVLADRWGLLRFDPSAFETRHDSKKKWFPFPKQALAALGVISLTVLVMAFFIKFEWDFKELTIKIPESETWKLKVNETTGRVNSPAVYIIDDEAQARAIAREIRHRKAHDTNFDTIYFYRSYYDMIPFDQDEKLALLKKIDWLLSDDVMNTLSQEEKDLVKEFRLAIKETRRIQASDVDQSIYELFWGNTGKENTSVSYIWPLSHLQLGEGRVATNFYKDVYEVGALGKNFYAISDSIVFAQVLITLFKDSRIAISLAVIVLITLIALHFRKWREVTFIFVALFFGIAGMLALMVLFDMKLNFYNMIIISAMLGMGVDNSVHVTHRFEEGGHASIWEALRTSGGAALMATLTTMFGYAGLCLTVHPGLTSIGWMAIMGMGSCLVGSLVILPLLLQVFLRKQT